MGVEGKVKKQLSELGEIPGEWVYTHLFYKANLGYQQLSYGNPKLRCFRWLTSSYWPNEQNGDCKSPHILFAKREGGLKKSRKIENTLLQKKQIWVHLCSYRTWAKRKASKQDQWSHYQQEWQGWMKYMDFSIIMRTWTLQIPCLNPLTLLLSLTDSKQQTLIFIQLLWQKYENLSVEVSLNL